ncbi:hypothetical protein ABZ260_27715, partial [Streptosporangium sp. NPDC006013]|uniref:hypothetical protein n=1 Tax=Streptosporangium sp. NPDC006013 TaxID=3155596 RepID=UPI0033AF2037
RPGSPPAGTGAHAARPGGGRQRAGYGGAARRRLTDERQREVARKLDGLARGALTKGSGTQRARERKKAE